MRCACRQRKTQQQTQPTGQELRRFQQAKKIEQPARQTEEPAWQDGAVTSEGTGLLNGNGPNPSGTASYRQFSFEQRQCFGRDRRPLHGWQFRLSRLSACRPTGASPRLRFQCRYSRRARHWSFGDQRLGGDRRNLRGFQLRVARLHLQQFRFSGDNDLSYSCAHAKSLGLSGAGHFDRSGLFHRRRSTKRRKRHIHERHRLHWGRRTLTGGTASLTTTSLAVGDGLHHGGLRRRCELCRQHLGSCQPDGQPGQLYRQL